MSSVKIINDSDSDFVKVVCFIYLSYLIFVKSELCALLTLWLDSVGDFITRSVVGPWSGHHKSTSENVSA